MAWASFFLAVLIRNRFLSVGSASATFLSGGRCAPPPGYPGGDHCLGLWTPRGRAGSAFDPVQPARWNCDLIRLGGHVAARHSYSQLADCST